MLVDRRGLPEEDAKISYKLRCSLLHGHGVPKPNDVSDPGGGSDRKLVLTDAQEGFAVDTTRTGFISVSVPLFCGRLVERIVAEAPDDWDVASINTDYRYLP